MGYMAPEQAYGKPTLALRRVLARADRLRAPHREAAAPGRSAGRPSATTASAPRCPSRCGRCCRRRARSIPPTATVRRSSSARRSRPAFQAHRGASGAAGAAPAAKQVSRSDARHRSRSAWSSSSAATAARSACATAATAATGPIAEAMSVCPWCGSADNSFKEITSAPLDLRPLRARRAARVDRLPVVSRGPLQGQRPAAAARSAGGPPLQRGAAARASCGPSCATARCASGSPEGRGATRTCPSAARAAAGPPRRPSSASAPSAAGASARIVDSVYLSVVIIGPMARPALRPDEIESFRARLCEAAMQMFADEGYDAVTLRALAEKLECSHALPYRYFADKREIFARGVRARLRALRRRARARGARGIADPERAPARARPRLLRASRCASRTRTGSCSSCASPRAPTSRSTRSRRSAPGRRCCRRWSWRCRRASSPASRTWSRTSSGPAYTAWCRCTWPGSSASAAARKSSSSRISTAMLDGHRPRETKPHAKEKAMTLDATWPQHPNLQGAFAPYLAEDDTTPLEVVGRDPARAHGTLYRNGPNPQFPPRGGMAYHWFDGDGMIHAISLADGRAQYQEPLGAHAPLRARAQGGPRAVRRADARWPRATRRRMRALDAQGLSPYEQVQLAADAGNTNIVWHARKLLALLEIAQPDRARPAHARHPRRRATSTASSPAA